MEEGAQEEGVLMEEGALQTKGGTVLGWCVCVLLASYCVLDCFGMRRVKRET
jgi:hypothetical protein